MIKKNIRFIIIISLSLLITIISGRIFLNMHELAPLYPSSSVTETKMLSNYLPALENTPGDTPIYIMDSGRPGGSVFILGGTHPSEPASSLASIILLENLKVKKGKVFIIPRGNISAFTHNEPLEAHPKKYFIDTPNGQRWFRYGARVTNPIHQWPDPEIYVHQSGQKLSGSEVRNLNRCYPGKEDSYLTEKVALGIINLLKDENIDLSIDLHEASLEYPVINAIVAHENSEDLAVMAKMDLQFKNLDYSLEMSPKNFRGLSHREWGDNTETLPILMETANPIQGRLRGETDWKLVVNGKDKSYLKAAKLDKLYVEYDENGIPLKERVGRHLTAINELLIKFNELNPDKSIEVQNIPSYSQLMEKGCGSFLEGNQN